MPVWLDDPALSPTFDITYDKSAITVGKTKGLLLLHHHNTAGNTAEVLPIADVSSFITYLPLIRR